MRNFFRRCRHRAVFPLVVTLAIAVPCSALVELFGAQPMPVVSSWPAGLRELVNDKGRFAGSIGPIADTHGYYSGDTKSLSAFLKKLGGLKDTTVYVSVQDRDYAVKMKEFDGTDRTVEADWILHIAERMASRPDIERFKGRPLYAEVTISRANQVRLADLEVPVAFDVAADEAHKDFERRHKARQEQQSE